MVEKTGMWEGERTESHYLLKVKVVSETGALGPVNIRPAQCDRKWPALSVGVNTRRTHVSDLNSDSFQCEHTMRPESNTYLPEVSWCMPDCAEEQNRCQKSSLIHNEKL